MSDVHVDLLLPRRAAEKGVGGFESQSGSHRLFMDTTAGKIDFCVEPNAK